MGRFLLVCAGGALGTGARYLLATWALRALGTGFAWGTLLVNVLGSLLIGAVMTWGAASGALSDTARLTLTTGVLGGFTTYSAFNHESLRLLGEGGVGPFALNVGLMLLACFAAGALGMALGRWAA